MRELLRSKHFLVTLDEGNRLLRRARTHERFESMEEVESAYAELLRVLRSIDRPEYAQLIDARAAPPRNDPAFEAVVTRHHVELYDGFRRAAVLVQSAAGRLQVRRMLEGSGVDAPVFTEEEAALVYLQGRGSFRPPP
jgi:hypothetical protein